MLINLKSVFKWQSQGRIQEFALGGRHAPFLSPPFPSLPLRSRAPLNQLVGLGSAVSSPRGIQGGDPAENEFGAL